LLSCPLDKDYINKASYVNMYLYLSIAIMELNLENVVGPSFWKRGVKSLP